MDAFGHRDPRIISLCAEALERLASEASALRFAAVLTADGFAVHSLTTGQEVDDGRFASIASTLQALGEAAGRELVPAAGRARVLISTDAGLIAQLRVGETNLALAALFDDAPVQSILTQLDRTAAAFDLGIRSGGDPAPAPAATLESTRRAL